MRHQLLFPVILVAAAGVYAQSPPEQEKAGGAAPPEVETDSGDRTGKKPPAPAATFTPTEKIEADSAVSFPVDI
ncbi:MAG: hypothetical protein ACR2O5_10320 [Thiogranum sp.]